VDPEGLGGKPSIRGLRISVGMLVQMVVAGKSAEEIITEYPYLEPEGVRQAMFVAAAQSTHPIEGPLRSR
jgi:uncharacterized protein (DUF433 family)